jgi:endonuclease/exonuclease/phosphatase family metal-dependent hydrolase
VRHEWSLLIASGQFSPLYIAAKSVTTEENRRVVSSRVFRLIEGSLVVLFMLQAARISFAMLLSAVERALDTGAVDVVLASSHLMLVMMLALPWLAPRSRTLLPRVMLVCAVMVGAGRLVAAIPHPITQLYGSILTLGFAGVYLSTLLRANRRSWVTILVLGVAVEQTLRALDSYDLLFHLGRTDIPVADQRLTMPMIVLHAALTLCLILASSIARRFARYEPYEPGFLTTTGGLAFGGFLAIEFLVLGLSNIVARWSDVPYETVVPLILLATTIPLLPSVRAFAQQVLGIFDERLRGWVWLFVVLLLLIVGNRLNGLGAASALLLAQFMTVMLLWWIPSPPDPDEVEQVGPSLSLGLFIFVTIVYFYSLTFTPATKLGFLNGQGLTAALIAAVLAGLARLSWREIDPWAETALIPRSLPAAFVAPVVVLGLLMSSTRTAQATPLVGQDIRIATYNINDGYDATGSFQLEFAAESIEASLADIVLLQEADIGRPTSYGIDQVKYLAERLQMYEAYLPVTGHEHGVAILSRWPIVARHSVVVTGPGAVSVLRVRIIDPDTGRALEVISAQFATAEPHLHQQQLAALFQLISEKPFDPSMPTVLGLDAGAALDDDSYNLLTGDSFDDPDADLGIEHGFTYPAGEPTERRDYLFIRAFRAVDARQVKSAASDHRLVVVEVRWP